MTPLSVFLTVVAVVATMALARVILAATALPSERPAPPTAGDRGAEADLKPLRRFGGGRRG